MTLVLQNKEAGLAEVREDLVKKSENLSGGTFVCLFVFIINHFYNAMTGGILWAKFQHHHRCTHIIFPKEANIPSSHQYTQRQQNGCDFYYLNFYHKVR